MSHETDSTKLSAEARAGMRAAAHLSWANTEDRSARTRNGRAGLQAKFLREAGGDPVKAEHLRKAFYARMNAASLKSRRAKAAAASR